MQPLTNVNRLGTPLPARQRGVVLLSFMLVVIAAASFVLLKGLNEASQGSNGFGENNTRAVLKEAKAALIGYSISYPDHPDHVTTKGPGRLPCPDYQHTTGQKIGEADACSLGSETGLFPFHTIKTNEMVDASGTRLWYAVSDNHRSSGGGVVNSDTAGTLNVDAENDIVAVIIAPGAAIANQNRSLSETEDHYDIDQYLEGENATAGDNLFTRISTEYVNDEVITITRAELMAAAENRVLSTVSRALNQYFDDPDGDDNNGNDPDCPTGINECDNAYPWLAPFTNPALSDYEAVVGTRDGHIPVVTNGRSFSTMINFDWDIPIDGTYAGSSTFDPTNSCARVAVCDVGGVSTQLPIGDGDATCTWLGVRSLNCSTVETVDLPSGDQLEREYTFEFTNISMTVDPPTATAPRRLNYVLPDNGRIPPDVSLARITLSDNIIFMGGGREDRGTVSLTLTPGDSVNFLRLQGMTFDLEIDNDDVMYPTVATDLESSSPGELPAWFFEDEWHHLVVVSYAQAEEPDDLDANCVADGSCLSLFWDREGDKPDSNLNQVRAVAIAAGGDLTGSRPSAVLSDYFENQNATQGDLMYSKIDGVTNFNDQIKVLDPDG